MLFQHEFDGGDDRLAAYVRSFLLSCVTTIDPRSLARERYGPGCERKHRHQQFSTRLPHQALSCFSRTFIGRDWLDYDSYQDDIESQQRDAILGSSSSTTEDGR